MEGRNKTLQKGTSGHKREMPVRVGGSLAAWIHLTLRTIPPQVLEVSIDMVPPGMMAVGSKGYLH
jgi:hypothetical protein